MKYQIIVSQIFILWSIKFSDTEFCEGSGKQAQILSGQTPGHIWHMHKAHLQSDIDTNICTETSKKLVKSGSHTDYIIFIPFGHSRHTRY